MNAFSLPSFDRMNNILTIFMAAFSILAMALGIFGESNSGSSNSSGSSGGTINEGYPFDGAFPLDLTRGDHHGDLRTQLYEIYNRSRTDAGLAAIIFDGALESNAAAQAEYSARNNEFKANNNNVMMVQIKVPYAASTAAQILTEFYKDPATNAVLSRSDIKYMGIGVASSEGHDWVVIQVR